MAKYPPWIKTPEGGEWVLQLTGQTAQRAGFPSNDSILVEPNPNGKGCFIESIFAKPTNPGVASVLFVFLYKPSTKTYHLIGERALPTIGAVSAASDTGRGVLTVDLPLIQSFPPLEGSATTNRGLLLSPSSRIHVGLQTATAASWRVFANGGEL